MQQADCLGCHKSEAASIGPDFASIAARYRGGDGTRERLAQSTISGSSGIWGDAIMPAHPDLSLPEARSIASYILSFGDGSTGTESILGGILHFNQHIEADAMGVVAGVYHIEGSYADKGANGVPALTGSKRIELVWPKLRMDAADGGDLNMLFDIPDNEMIPDEARFLIGEKVALARGGSHLFYSNLDLSGIHAIDFDIVSSRLITSGGTLQLRLDSPGGEILGSIEVDAGLSMENKIRTITLARDFDGKHDLYLLFVGEESEMLFVVISMEFRKA
jgi:cytochrome c